jgi:hypothetical protein
MLILRQNPLPVVLARKTVMTEGRISNVAEQAANSGKLRPGQSLELKFVPGMAGEINVVALAIFGSEPIPGFGFARRVELFAPGDEAPTASTEDRAVQMPTILPHLLTQAQAALNGEWIARVTNIDKRSANFRLEVAFPRAVKVNTTEVPTNLMETIAHNLLVQTKLRIARGTDASFVQLPAVLSVEPTRFTIPDLDRTINLLMVRLRIVEFPNDISSSSTQFALVNSSEKSPSGALRLSLGFEEAGREMLGTFQADLNDVQVSIELPLDVEDHKLTYSLVRATCFLKADVTRLPDGILTAVFHYLETLERRVVEAVEETFDCADVRMAIANGLTAALAPLLGANNAIASVTIADGKLSIASFAPGKRAAA